MIDALELPKHVTSFTAKGRLYYRYRRKGRSIALGSDLAAALLRAKELEAAPASKEEGNKPYVNGYVKNAMRLKRASARYRAQTVTLTDADIEQMLHEQDYRCAVSGIAFRFDRGDIWNPKASRNRHPFSPSIDRITAGGPYSRENSRIVCLIVNLARSNFGDEALLTMAEGVVKVSHKSAS